MTPALNAFVNVGGNAVMRVELWAVLPEQIVGDCSPNPPLQSYWMVTLLVSNPRTAEVTKTVKTHEAPPFSTAFAREMDPAPTEAVITPPPQEPMTEPATVMPNGKVSTNPMLPTGKGFGLAMVKAKENIDPSGATDALKLFEMVGGVNETPAITGIEHAKAINRTLDRSRVFMRSFVRLVYHRFGETDTLFGT
jgi:hypothetical protein